MRNTRRKKKEKKKRKKKKGEKKKASNEVKKKEEKRGQMITQLLDDCLSSVLDWFDDENRLQSKVCATL